MRDSMMIQCDEYNEVWDDESRQREWEDYQAEMEWQAWLDYQEECEGEVQSPPTPAVESYNKYYFELYINSLSNRYRYDVREELKTGRLITHSVNVSYDEMKDYVRMVWIDSCPPKFVISVTQEY